MKNLVFVLGALCVPFVVACGSGSSSGTARSSQASTAAQEGDSCGGFVANPQKCDESQNLYCKSNGVPDMPGTCTTCDGFGLLPHIAEVCADGSEGTAHWVAENGTCQVEVCPTDGNGNSSNSCQQPSDCTGLLPQMCEQCADGTSQCAHWDCNSGACQTTTCEDNGGPASVGDDGGTAGDDGGSGDDGGGNQCQAASDCTGFLPSTCEQCADGTSQCAHWDCNANACQITICEDNGGAQ
jgi:hypothetical protein